MATTRASSAANANRPQVWAILVTVLGLLLIGRGAWDMAQAITFAAGGVATEGRVTGVTSVNQGRGRVAYYARVRYAVDGKSMAATTEDRVERDQYKVGDVIRLSYLSSEPERVRTADTAGKIGFFAWLILGLGLAIGGGGLYWLLRVRRRPDAAVGAR